MGNDSLDPPDEQSTAVRPRRPERTIAGYRLVRRLGAGGMGIVFEAEQERPRRLVALKVIRGGVTVDEHHVKLFAREAQALARLKHPSIATLYEMGSTDDGDPFFAMELVRGTPLDAAMAEGTAGGAVGPRERLRLFIKICEAVNYAHQRGVIHRDLKPSNIMVAPAAPTVSSGTTRQPVPDVKILDFGLARITDADVTATTMAAGAVQGTLAYMSPEQARGNPDEIDVRSDVYSLGVILYEFLTGRRPYDLEGRPTLEVLRIICEEAPLRPRRGCPGLDHDLETILMKSLEKDPARRYQSALALAEDLERYLVDQPIQARAPSTVYQLRKLVFRHRAAVAAGLAVLVLLAVFAASMAVQRNIAREAGSRAEAEATRAREVSDFLVAVFRSSDPRAPAADRITARELLDAASTRIERELEADDATRARLMHTMGRVYLNLGLYDRSQTLLERALELRRPTSGPEATAVAESLQALAETLFYRGDSTRAIEAMEQAREIWERTLGPESPEVATALNDLGVMRFSLGAREEVEPLYQRALAIRQSQLGPQHPLVGETLGNLAALYGTLRRYDETAAYRLRAIEIIEAALGPGHPDLVSQYRNLAWSRVRQGRYREALAAFEHALSIAERSLGNDHPQVASSLTALAACRITLGSFEQAIGELERALAIHDRRLGPEHRTTANTLRYLSNAHRMQGSVGEAVALAERALAMAEKLLSPDNEIAGIAASLAHAYRDAGREAEADVLYERARRLRSKPGIEHEANLAYIAHGLARLRHRQARFREAEELYLQAIDTGERALGGGHPDTALVVANLARLYRDTGRASEAQSLYRRALPVLEEALLPSHPWLVACRTGLAQVKGQLRGPKPKKRL